MSFAIDSSASSLVKIYVDLETGQRFHSVDLPLDKLAQGTVDEILAVLPDLSDLQLNALTAIESADKSRITLLDAIQSQLASNSAPAAKPGKTVK